MAIWVRSKHKDDAKRWEVSDECHPQDSYAWCVWTNELHLARLILPKDEYRECKPPEKWEDVTVNFYVTTSEDDVKDDNGWVLACGKGYRFRKIDGMHNGPAFIIERKVT